MFKQSIPAAGVSLEQGTPEVPDDSRYHVLVGGVVVGSYRSKPAALRRYREEVERTGYTPPPKQAPSREDLLREDIEKDMLRTATYWAGSSKHSSGGGKLRNR